MGRISIVYLIFTALSLANVSSLAAARYLPGHATVFMYHRFGEYQFPSTNIRVEQFKEQLQFLEDNEFTVLPLEEIVEALKGNTSLPDKSVAITIDDAYRSVYETAYPLLQQYDFPFTVFIAPNTIDQGASAYMSWQQVREMHENGVTFANHSLNHDYLVRKKKGESDQAWTERVSNDIADAQQRIMAELGDAPNLFAYPYGEYNLQLMEVVKAQGYWAFGQHSGSIGPLSDVRALPRFPIAEAFADMASFKIKALSLPMPVLYQDPVDPQTSEKRPTLTVKLAPSELNAEQLACYLNGKQMHIRWLKPGESFDVQADKDLPAGRSRYNCTAPDRSSKRYFWYSHLWILPIDG
jgi:peptidoglycan/xylan/chitin deacetylase (PgdA/CDA1 family)